MLLASSQSKRVSSADFFRRFSSLPSSPSKQLQRLQEVEDALSVRQREGAQLQGRVLELEERNTALQAALTTVSAEGGAKAHDKARAEDLESRLKAAGDTHERM
jgi:small-conductance mechanosensitive channel